MRSNPSKALLNNINNRFLPIPPSVANSFESEPKFTDFRVLKEIGKGSFGYVYLVTHKGTKKQYAIKAIDKRNKTNQEGRPYFRREIEIMYKIHHPNVIHLYSHFEDEKNCYFLMEYAPNGNLYNYVSKKPTQTLEPKNVAEIIVNLIYAVYYLHTMNPPIIHRDIKPENVLLDQSNQIKLTDFGWSNYIEDYGDLRSTFCGTPIYLAPEIIMNAGHDERVDIWCLGVLMYELLCGHPPFSGKDRTHLLQNILRLKMTWPRTIDNEAKNLIQSILKINPNERISLIEIIRHPFIKKYIPEAENNLIEEHSENKITPYIVSKGIYAKNNSNENNRYDSPTKNKKTQNENSQSNTKIPNFNNKYIMKREVSPLPKSRLHLEKIEIIKAGKNQNKYYYNLGNVNKSNNGNITTNSNKEDASLDDSTESPNSSNKYKRKKNSNGTLNISQEKYEKIQNENEYLKKLISQYKNDANEYKYKFNEAIKLSHKLREENKSLVNTIEDQKDEINSLKRKLKMFESNSKEKRILTARKMNISGKNILDQSNNSNDSNYTPERKKKLAYAKKLNLNSILSKSFELNKNKKKIEDEDDQSEEVQHLKYQMKKNKEKYESEINELNMANDKLKEERDNRSTLENEKYNKL
ncbi:MAG: protein kinase, partial [archaeon]|nr:protein kinase [archaeon]